MSGSSPSSDPRVPRDDGSHISGEIVREQTVRARIPTPPVTTGDTAVAPMPSAPMPSAPVAEAPMVPRSWIPTPAAPHYAATEELPEPGRRRSSTLRAEQLPEIGRADPPAVSGEVMVTDTSSSGPQPLVSESELRGSESELRRALSTDPGSMVRSGIAEVTGPQPHFQAESTGPQPAMRPNPVTAPQSAMILWVVAGGLVLLAGAVVAFVLTR